MAHFGSSQNKCTFHCQTVVCCLSRDSWNSLSTSSTPCFPDISLKHRQTYRHTGMSCLKNEVPMSTSRCSTREWPYTPATNPALVLQRTGHKWSPMLVLQKRCRQYKWRVSGENSINLVNSENLSLFVLPTGIQLKHMIGAYDLMKISQLIKINAEYFVNI